MSEETALPEVWAIILREVVSGNARDLMQFLIRFDCTLPPLASEVRETRHKISTYSKRFNCDLRELRGA